MYHNGTGIEEDTRCGVVDIRKGRDGGTGYNINRGRDGQCDGMTVKVQGM